jgi:PAS domain S-box-containing protein
VSIKILIVANEVIVVEDIKDALEELGYIAIDIADSGIEAIAKAAVTQPDLVLINIDLKQQIGGIQTATEICDRYRIPVVFLTTDSDLDRLEQAKTIKPFSCIIKPFRKRDIQKTIEIIIQKYQLEKQLKDREQWLTTLLASISDAVIATDERYCVTSINPAAESLTGWKQEEVLGKNVTEILHFVDTTASNLIENSIPDLLQASFNVAALAPKVLIAKNGIELPIDNKTAIVQDEQGYAQGTIVVLRDMTQQIEAEQIRIVRARAEQLETQMAEMERLHQLKDDFLNTVSHELRTPMANIRMAVKMLEISLNRTREDTISSLVEVGDSLPCGNASGERDSFASRNVQRYLQILKDECSREIELIENILDLQRLEAGGQTFIPEVIHLQTLIPQLVEPFQERAKSHQQTLQVELPKNLEPIISDAASIGRIIAELLNNACKYTPMAESIALNVIVTADKVRLQVCNTGVEIPARELSHVFEKFYRVPSNDPWKQGGTGLGLALVQKLCEQLGGSIFAESRDKKTCFTVELPIVLS